jgi:hypothetical protein
MPISESPLDLSWCGLLERCGYNPAGRFIDLEARKFSYEDSI